MIRSLPALTLLSLTGTLLACGEPREREDPGGRPDDAPGGVPGDSASGGGGSSGGGGDGDGGAGEGDGDGDSGRDDEGDSGGGGEGDGGTCSPAPDLLDFALCVCEDFTDIGFLEVGSEAYPGRAVAGINGFTRFAAGAAIHGSLRAFGGFEALTVLDVEANLSTAESMNLGGEIHVGRDLYVANDLTGIGRLEVDGTLRVGGTEAFVEVDANHRADYDITAVMPCNCEPSRLFDVPGVVAQARALNDNAAHGLPTSFASVGGDTLDLPAGRYYFTGLDAIGALRIRVEGAVSLYLEGDLTAIGGNTMELADDAVLDVYVSGIVGTVGAVELGDRDRPGAFRLFIGGSGSAQVAAGAQVFHGSIYAPTADIAYGGDTLIRGSLFAKSLNGVGRIVIEQQALEDLPPEACPPDCLVNPEGPDCDPPPPPVG